MFKRSEANLEIMQGKDWSLGVTKEFKELVGKNPDLVPTEIELLEIIFSRASGVYFNKIP